MRPKSVVETGIGLVPALASARPYFALKPLMQTFGKGFLGLRFGVNIGQPAFCQPLDKLGDVMHLRLNHNDYGIMAESAIGAQQHEEIRKTRNCHRAVRGDAAGPAFGKVAPAGAGNAEFCEKVKRLEAGGKNDDIGGVRSAVLRDNAGFGNFGNTVGNQLGMGALQGFKISVDHQNALAADLKVGRQLGAQLFIGNQIFQMVQRLFAEPALHETVGEKRREKQQFAAQI